MDLLRKVFEVAICDLRKRNIENLKSQSVISNLEILEKNLGILITRFSL